MALELQITTPDRQTERHTLGSETLSVGRAHSNDLSFPDDASLSRKHLSIEPDGESWIVDDLKSKNGTLLNRTRIAARTFVQGAQ